MVTIKIKQGIWWQFWRGDYKSFSISIFANKNIGQTPSKEHLIQQTEETWNFSLSVIPPLCANAY